MCELNVHSHRRLEQLVLVRDGGFASVESCRYGGFIRVNSGLVVRQCDGRLGKYRGVFGQAFQGAGEKIFDRPFRQLP